MRYPLDDIRITQEYGVEVSYMIGNFHWGVDLGVPIGTPIYAIEDGRVLGAYESTTGYGNQVRILHDNNAYMSLYAHLDSFTVKDSEMVHEGQIIGYSGNSGRSTGPHLHFEIRVNNKPVDPLQFIDNNNNTHNEITMLLHQIVNQNQEFLNDITNGKKAYFRSGSKWYIVENGKIQKEYNSPQEMISDNMCLGLSEEDKNKLI